MSPLFFIFPMMIILMATRLVVAVVVGVRFVSSNYFIVTLADAQCAQGGTYPPGTFNLAAARYTAKGCSLAPNALVTYDFGSPVSNAARALRITGCTLNALSAIVLKMQTFPNCTAVPLLNPTFQIRVAGNSFKNSAVLRIYGSLQPGSRIIVTKNTFELNAVNQKLPTPSTGPIASSLALGSLGWHSRPVDELDRDEGRHFSHCHGPA